MVGSSAVGAFGARLRALREARSLTQEELADRSGLSAKAVSALERGDRRRPHPHTVRALADALGLDDAERSALVAAVPRRGAPAVGRAAAAAPEAGASGKDAFPVEPATALIGRDVELARVTTLLTARRARLVTLTGPGGIGKTRLAVEVMARATDAFPGGVLLVDLAAVREPALVLPRVAAALGVVEPPAVAAGLVEHLAGHLVGRDVLLVLDNLEQVISCAPVLADLLARAPALAVLATSRAPLRVRAEHEVPVPPLGLPEATDPADVQASAAVAMLLERAAAAGADLVVTERSAPVLAALVRRLDGIPLAIELAAAAARVLPPDALLDRLEHGGEVGVAGPRDLPDRQRSMTAVLDWSLELLQPHHRELFLRAAVFSGGFSLDSLEAVAAAVGADPGQALPGVAALVEQSLVLPAASPDGSPRFRLLEPVRQHAVARSHAAGLALPTADAHAGHVRAMALEAHHRLWAGRIGPVLDRLEADHANLRSGFLRLLELERVADAADLAGALWPYFAVRGRVREGLAWLDRVDGAGTASAAARAHVGRMGLLLVVGDVPGMRRLGHGAVELATRAGDLPLTVEATLLSALAAVFAGDLGTGDQLLSRVEDAGDALDGSPGDGARDALRWSRLHLSVGRGQSAMLAGDVGTATGHLEAAVALARELGNEFGLATALNTLATAREVAGDDAGAALLLGESLALSSALRLGWTLGYAVPALAGVAARAGRAAAAARLFGAAATLGDSTAVDPHFPPSRATADAGLLVARDQLGEAGFVAAWEAGRTATPDEVARLAAEVVAEVVGMAEVSEAADGLSAREPGR